MGKDKFRPPSPGGSEPPKRISTKLGIYDCVVGMTTQANLANPYGTATTWVV